MATIRVKRTDGSSTPSGLTFGEPAYVQGLKSLYIGQTGGDPALRVGAEVTIDGTLASNSDNKIPTEKAVKTYVTSAITSNTVGVATINGLTGTVTVAAGTAIDVSTAGQTITVTNQGVHSAVAGSGIAVSGATGTVTFTNVGVTGLVSGTAISISGSTGNITVTNTGVQSLSGTSNQISVSGSTGAVTLSLPSAIIAPGSLSVTTDLTVTGNLTVNGSTTTVNSDTMTIDDPMITLGLSGGLPISVSDGGKDRGIAFTYYDTTGRTGFFGWDASAAEFVFLRNTSISNDVVTGNTYGNLRIGNSLALVSSSGLADTITPSGNNSNHTLSQFSGTIVSASGEGTTNYILKSNATSGIPGAPTWINPNAAGFTAYAAGRLETARTIGVTGDVWGSASFDGTANINIATTIQPNSIALGTDTTGNYLATLSTTSTGLTLSGSGVESAAVSINLATITSGLNMELFTFAASEFINTSGTVSIGVVDGGSF